MNMTTSNGNEEIRFSNAVINEFLDGGKKIIQTEIKEVLASGEIKIDELSVGIEFTDGHIKHLYDSFYSLCRYKVFSYVPVSYNLVIVKKGTIISRFTININNLQPNFKELVNLYLKKHGLMLLYSNSPDWEQHLENHKFTSLKSLVSNITTDPLA